MSKDLEELKAATPEERQTITENNVDTLTMYLRQAYGTDLATAQAMLDDVAQLVRYGEFVDSEDNL